MGSLGVVSGVVLCIALLLTSPALGCGYEEVVLAEEADGSIHRRAANFPSDQDYTGATSESFRLKFDTHYLDSIDFTQDPVDYGDGANDRTCTSVGQVVYLGLGSGSGITLECVEPDADNGVAGITTKCQYTCQSDDIITETVRDLIMEELIPYVKEVLSNVLSIVESVPGDLVLSDDGTTFAECHTNADFGVLSMPDADMAIVVSVRPTSGSLLAYAGSCAADSTTSMQRIFAGYINFGPSSLDITKTSLLEMKKLALHEVFHAIGYQNEKMETAIHTYGAGTKMLEEFTAGRVEEASIVTSAKVRALARDHYNCPTLPGMLLENNGGAGTVGTHWERRVLTDEIMVATSSEIIQLTEMTLALMEDLGWYTYNTTSEYIIPMYWGKDAGCTFFDDGPTFTSFEPYRCSSDVDEDQTRCMPGRRAGSLCNTGFGSVTVSGTDVTPQWGNSNGDGEYYLGKELDDYFPIIKMPSNRVCNNDGYTGSDKRGDSGNQDSSSRCFVASLHSQVYANPTGTAAKGSCFNIRCIEGTTDYIVKTGSVWTTCSSLTQSVATFENTISCPDYAEICTAEMLLDYEIESDAVCSYASVEPSTVKHNSKSTITISGTFDATHTNYDVILGTVSCEVSDVKADEITCVTQNAPTTVDTAADYQTAVLVVDNNTSELYSCASTTNTAFTFEALSALDSITGFFTGTVFPFAEDNPVVVGAIVVVLVALCVLQCVMSRRRKKKYDRQRRRSNVEMSRLNGV